MSINNQNFAEDHFINRPSSPVSTISPTQKVKLGSYNEANDNFDSKISKKPINIIPESTFDEFKLSLPNNGLENDYSEQSSYNPSPISHEMNSSNSINFNSSNEQVSNNNSYLRDQFFVEETMGQNSYLDNNINLFDLSPDQQLAIKELELRRQQTEFEDDYDYSMNYDQILDYDVREKLESLNAQLANEPAPPEPEHRNSKVAFKDELVSLVAPPDEYELSESEHEEATVVDSIPVINHIEITNEPLSKSSVLSSDRMPTPESTEKIDDLELQSYILSQSSKPDTTSSPLKETDFSTTKEIPTESDKINENNIVVSRGGEFKLMGQDDMIDSSDNTTNINDNIIEHDKPRPISAPSNKRNRNEVWSNNPLDSSNSSVRSEMNYRSKTLDRSNTKMDVPRVDRDLLQRQKEREENKKKEQKEKEELEAENRRQMNEKCFKAWLQNKNKSSKDDMERKRKDYEDEKSQKEKQQEERKNQAQEKEKEMSKNWELYKRREEKLRQYRIKEMEESIVVHTKVECQRAFKEWIKKKRANNQLKEKEEKQKARITRLAMRQCRKSQNLAQAIHQANSFRYLDFYGYP